jgi:hypothetical protein
MAGRVSLPRVGRVEIGAPNVANRVDLMRKGLQQAGSLLQNKMAAPAHVTVKYLLCYYYVTVMISVGNTIPVLEFLNILCGLGTE